MLSEKGGNSVPGKLHVGRRLGCLTSPSSRLRFQSMKCLPYGPIVIYLSCAQVPRYPSLPPSLEYMPTTAMAFRPFTPALLHLRTPVFAASLGISGAVLLHQTFQSRKLLRLDSAASPVSPRDWSFSQYQHDVRNSVVDNNGKLNPRAVRQLSAGSIFGTTTPICRATRN